MTTVVVSQTGRRHFAERARFHGWWQTACGQQMQAWVPTNGESLSIDCARCRRTVRT